MNTKGFQSYHNFRLVRGSRKFDWGEGTVPSIVDVVGNFQYVKNGANSPGAISPAHTLVDLGFGYVGIYGGLPGAAVSAGYFMASPYMWFTPGTVPPMPVPEVDNSYVAPRQ